MEIIDKYENIIIKQIVKKNNIKENIVLLHKLYIERAKLEVNKDYKIKQYLFKDIDLGEKLINQIIKSYSVTINGNIIQTGISYM